MSTSSFQPKTGFHRFQRKCNPGFTPILQALVRPFIARPSKVGGVADHVHLLFRLARTISVSDAVKDIKVESSKWMKTDAGVPVFAWQAGYGAFSIGASQIDDVMDYIRRQAEHHAKRSFQEEFRLLLKRYGVGYDEAYVWD